MAAVTILIPAAGASARMRGADKLLQPVGGEPLLARQARVARATGAEVIVTLPPRACDRRLVLRGADVRKVTVPDAAEGMAASLRAGVAALAPGTAGLMVLLADLPELETTDLAAMIAGFQHDPGAILRATAADGRPGHPVLFPARLFGGLSELSGDEGARRLLAANLARILPVPLPGNRATTDLDTPEDWALWRRATGL